jgi:hypothetical protein
LKALQPSENDCLGSWIRHDVPSRTAKIPKKS